MTPPEPVKPPTPEPADAAPPPKPTPPRPTPQEIKRDQDAQAEILRQDQKNQERVAVVAREKAEKAEKVEIERKRQEKILLEQEKEQEEQARREQAIVIAIGREFGRPYNSGPGMQAEQAMNFAKKFPDVVDILADTLGHRLTVQFKSGWRTAILPIPDGKVGDSTKIPS